ncbi:MAG: 3-hydroxybutyrate dehydrogenase [Gammaproteobacteria bacterium]|nr:3-hydroxybutyrate dehydrogenase [Gammaproteobacteria bacterium]
MSGFSLKNRIVLITGSDRGIGKAVALGFAGAGARVALHGLATPDEAKVVVKEMRDAGSTEARFFTGDLRDAGQVSALMERVLAWGTLDVLVNNAGIQRTGPLADITTDMWNDVIAVNLSAPFQTMRHALPRMAQAGYGRVINIASVHGLVASINKSPYVAAKFGLVGLSRVAALEYAPLGTAESGGITVNCICPGWVDTAIIAPQIAERSQSLGVSSEEALEGMVAEKQPTRRLSSPGEIARLACWLCAPEAHNITGTTIPIDGGWTAQ